MAERVISTLFLIGFVGLIFTKESSNQGFSKVTTSAFNNYAKLVRGLSG